MRNFSFWEYIWERRDCALWRQQEKGGATNLPKMDSETRAADKINRERDQL
jgi:hypothetical protein